MNSQMEFLKRMQTNHISLQNSMNRLQCNRQMNQQLYGAKVKKLFAFTSTNRIPFSFGLIKTKLYKIILHIFQSALVCDYSNCNFDIAARALIPG